MGTATIHAQTEGGSQRNRGASPPGLLFGAARPEDAAFLSDLTLRSRAVRKYDAAFLARCHKPMRLSAETILRHRHSVAAADGRILGFYGFEPEAEGVGLDCMFVEPGTIGRALWQHAVETARRLGHAALIVVSDPNAEGFYLRMGARRVGARPSEIEAGRLLPLLRFPLR